MLLLLLTDKMISNDLDDFDLMKWKIFIFWITKKVKKKFQLKSNWFEMALNVTNKQIDNETKHRNLEFFFVHFSPRSRSSSKQKWEKKSLPIFFLHFIMIINSRMSGMSNIWFCYEEKIISTKLNEMEKTTILHHLIEFHMKCNLQW